MIKIIKRQDLDNNDILTRPVVVEDIQDAVKNIIQDVIENGDEAVKKYCQKFDGATLDVLEVSQEEYEEAVQLVDGDFIEVLKRAAGNITRFHEKQLRSGYTIEQSMGVILEQKITPIEKAGIYVPGGTAAYPSTVLMDCIPAKIAGCNQVVMVTPPAENGKINPDILVAAQVAGVDKVFKVGGAQAIAALAYGTETIPKVDTIVGPGNAFVAEAKRQVFGNVSIDMIAGPSEILVVADSKANPAFVASDMLSQAEHDKMASAVLVTDSEELANNVAAEIEIQLSKLEREEIARASIENNGKIILTEDIGWAIEVANLIAPEHLELCLENPFDYVNDVKNAGSVFMGYNCPEALGDYFAGPNHTLPTSGTARFSSPLSVDDFTKKTQYIYYSKKAFANVAEDVAIFAKREGLTAHARSALVRIEEEVDE